MAIFPSLILEPTVQLNDKTRLDATKSFVSKDEAAVTLVRIKPLAAGSFITVTGTSSKDWYLDWQYSAAATNTVTVEITTDGSPTTYSATIDSITSTTDALWASDADLIAYESDIMKWVPAGRNSYLNIHRKAQKLIVDWFAQKRILQDDGTRFVASEISPTNEIKLLSIYWALQLIFEGISNKPDDVFAAKAKYYNGLVLELKNSGQIEADFDGSGTVDTAEKQDMFSVRMIR